MKPNPTILDLLKAIARDLEYTAMQLLNETECQQIAMRLQIDSKAIQQIHDRISSIEPNIIECIFGYDVWFDRWDEDC